jgi:hypothetical protein
MYPRLSISNKKPSAHTMGPLSSLSFNLFVLIYFLQIIGEKKLKNVKQEGCKFKQSLFSFLVLKQMQGAQYSSNTLVKF